MQGAISLPPPEFVLPPVKVQFADFNEKGTYINSVIEVCTKAINAADRYYNMLLYPQAQSNYLTSLDGYMSLLKITTDDANFQHYLKNQMKYLFTQVSAYVVREFVQGESCKAKMRTQLQDKRVAGYINHNDKPDSVFAFNNNFKHVVSDSDRQMKQQITDMLKSIDIQDENQVIPPLPQEVPKATAEKATVHKGLDPDIVRSIEESIMDHSPNVTWSDIKGLEDVKKILQETIVLPTLRPEIFQGLLSPSKGILLYGPPGNGKTMLAKAIATECKSTFFNCSASTLTSKWMGEGEKLMKTLFALANEKAPAVIFIDEIDSIMGARGGQEHEASRRLKTEFLIQFDGVNSDPKKSILVLAATNRPQDLDEAALRRFTRRIFMPLPDEPARESLIFHRLKDAKIDLSTIDTAQLLKMTEGYSCSDLQAVVKEAAMVPVRELTTEQLMAIKDTKDIRAITLEDFKSALKQFSPSVSKHTLEEFAQWQKSKGQN